MVCVLVWPFVLRGPRGVLRGHRARRAAGADGSGADNYVRDVTAGIFTAAYVPLFCSFATLMLIPGRRHVARADVHDLRGRLRRRRLRGGSAGRPAPDGPHDQPEEVVGGLRWVAGRPGWVAGRAVRHPAAARPVVGGHADRGAAGGQRHPRRPDRVDDQARHRDPRTWATCCRGTGADGPARLPAAHGGGGVGRAAARPPVADPHGVEPQAPIPSPNIWHWPTSTSGENAAQERRRSHLGRMRAAVPFVGRGPCSTSAAATGSTSRCSPRRRRRSSGWSPTARWSSGRGCGAATSAAAAPKPCRRRRERRLVHAARRTSSARAASPGSRKAQRVLRRAVHRDRRPGRDGAPVRRLDARRHPAIRPGGGRAVLRRAGILLPARPDPVAVPGPRDLRRGAADRVLPGGRRRRALAAVEGVEFPVGYRLHVRRAAGLQLA